MPVAMIRPSILSSNIPIIQVRLDDEYLSNIRFLTNREVRDVLVLRVSFFGPLNPMSLFSSLLFFWFICNGLN